MTSIRILRVWLTGGLTLLLPSVVQAQTGVPALPPARAASAGCEDCNAVKLDVLAPIPWLLGSMLNRQARYFPVLVAYERTLSPRLAVGLEAQTGGIVPATRRTGVALEGRCYLTLPDNPHWLGGLYVATRLRYLATYYDTHFPQPATIRGDWGAPEVLLGQQRPVPSFWLPGLLTEASIGLGYWSRLRPDAPSASPDDEPFMRRGWQPTVRVGLGYRF